MQRFPCPFCGQRDEREFLFVAEAGKTRPDTTDTTDPRHRISDEDWARYLHAIRNDKGAVREVWMHLTCGELFVLERDSTTMAVIRSIPLRKDAA